MAGAGVKLGKRGMSTSKRRVVKKIIRQKQEEDRARTLRFIQENGGTRCKLFWSDLKRQGKKRSGCIMEIKNHEGVLLTDPEEVKEKLRKYWEELGKVWVQQGIQNRKTQGEKWKWRP